MLSIDGRLTEIMNKKKYPPIRPQFLKDATGKTKAVYLDYSTYESIFEEIKELKKNITLLKKSKSKRK